MSAVIRRLAKLPKADELGPSAIICRLCRKEFRRIAPRHLRFIHGWKGNHPVEEYKRRFGLPVAASRDDRRDRRRFMEAYWTRQGHAWPRERVLAELRRRARGGRSLAVSRLGSSLNDALRRRFGTWERALRRAGIDPDAHRLCRTWTREDIAEAVRRLHRNGESLCGTRVLRDHPGLHSAAVRVAGNWGNALRRAGFDPEAHRPPTTWSLDIAATWIRKRHAARKSITTPHVPVGLLAHVRREHPGGWIGFVDAIGIPYPGKRARRDWTNEALLTAIRARKRRGLPINRGVVSEDAQALVHQARKRFGSWDAALRAAGFDPEDVRLARRWAPGEILARIRARHASGVAMDRASALADDSRLVMAAVTAHGSWGRALAAVGLPRELARARRWSPRRRRGWRTAVRARDRGKHRASRRAHPRR